MTLAPSLWPLPWRHLPSFFALPRPFHPSERPGVSLGGPKALKWGHKGKGRSHEKRGGKSQRFGEGDILGLRIPGMKVSQAKLWLLGAYVTWEAPHPIFLQLCHSKVMWEKFYQPLEPHLPSL